MRKNEAKRIYFSSRTSSLPEDMLEVLDLYVVQDKSYKETAGILNISVSATKQRVAKALFELRKISNDPEYIKARKILYGN